MWRLVVVGGAVLLGLLGGLSASRLEFTGGEQFLVSHQAKAEPVRRDPAEDTGDAPRVSVLNGETYDFGQMMRWGTLKHKFIFANKGEAPLLLTKGASSCKCTIANFESDEISLAPGETAEIELEWTAKTNAASFRQTAEIRTNDPGREIVQLVISGYVMESLRTEPPTCNFGNVLSSETREVQVVVVDTRDEHFEILGHRFAEPVEGERIEVNYEPATLEEAKAAFPPAKSGVKVTIKLLPGSPNGELSALLYLQTNLEDAREVEIPIGGHAISDITVIGGEKFVRGRSLLIWDSVPTGQGVQEKLALVIKGDLRDEVEVKIKEVFPAETLQVTLGEAKSTGKARVASLELSVPPNSAPINCMGGAANPLGYVILETTHPEIPEVKFQVRFAVN